MTSSIRQRFARKPKAEEVFHEADTNGDGVLSKEEFVAIHEEAPEAEAESTEEPENEQPL
jgi:hypothetical protein